MLFVVCLSRLKAYNLSCKRWLLSWDELNDLGEGDPIAPFFDEWSSDSRRSGERGYKP